MELSEEEKDAIETIEFLKKKKWYKYAGDNGTVILDEDEKKDVDIVLNLINKQQKEIEELKENELLEITENFISKDKIRELKEKVEKEMISNPYDFSYMINKLLEE